MSKPSNKNQTLKAANPSKSMSNLVNPGMMRGLSQLLAPGGMFGIPSMFKPRVLVKKQCLNCGTVHSHGNSYCSAYCCHTWREVNLQRGKANHYFGEFNKAYRTIDGVEELVS